VKIGRGPATVIGESAVSQATLPSGYGRAFFARENTVQSRPQSRFWGFFYWQFSQYARQGRLVPDSICKSVLRDALWVAGIALLCGSKLAAQTGAAIPLATAHEVSDEFGRNIRVPLNPQRIVSLAPSMTETVYALGDEAHLVGDTDYCDYPAQAQKKTKVGGVIDPNLEAIAALRPDLVLVTKSANRLDTVRALESLGIPSYATDPHTVEEIISSTQKLAEVLDVPAAGKTLADDLRKHLAELQFELIGAAPRRVLFVVWTDPLISVSRKTFIADAIHWAGATSIVESNQDWPQISLEEVVHLQPEYLVFASSHSGDGKHDFASLADRPGWRNLEAVRNNRFAVVSDAINRPSPRIVAVIEDLAHQLHPELFKTTPEQPKVPSSSPGLQSPSPKPVLSQSSHSPAGSETSCVR
jgi:iron complex transport system substrate-binding protein